MELEKIKAKICFCSGRLWITRGWRGCLQRRGAGHSVGCI